MSDRIYTQEELAALVYPVLEKYGAERAILFGSYARQEADAGSNSISVNFHIYIILVHLEISFWRKVKDLAFSDWVSK